MALAVSSRVKTVALVSRLSVAEQLVFPADHNGADGVFHLVVAIAISLWPRNAQRYSGSASANFFTMMSVTTETEAYGYARVSTTDQNEDKQI